MNYSETTIVEEKKVRLKNKPLLVAGLPGIGFVSKLAVDHLVRSLKAERVATLYSPHFPNQTLALRKGKLKPFTMTFYYKRFKSRDVLFLKGDLQPMTVEGQYEVTGKILEYFRGAGGETVVAMAGYAVPRPPKKPSVYCSSTHKPLLEQFLKLGTKKNPDNRIIPILGMAGMLPALSKPVGLQGVCLLVETSGANLDAQGAKALIEILSKAVGQKLDSKGVFERAKKAERLIKRLQQQKPSAQPTSKAPAETEDALFKRDVLNYIR